MDYTDDKGRRRYFTSEHAAEMELTSAGFDADDNGFYREEAENWITAEIRFNSQGYFIRVSLEPKN